MSETTSATQLTEKTTTFQRRFLLITSGIVAGVVTVLMILTAAIGDDNLVIQGCTFLIVATAVGTMALAYWHKLGAASSLFICSTVAMLGFVTLYQVEVSHVMFAGYLLVVLMAAFLMHPRNAPIVGAVAMVLMFVTAARVDGDREVMLMVIAGLSVMALSVIIYLFAKEASGNLGFLKSRLENNDALFQEVPGAASRLGAAAAEIFAMTEQQTQGTLRQASAIEETRQVLQSVAQAAGEIVVSARQTLGNAETTLSNSEQVADNVRVLSEHTRDIYRITELIKDVANKSDLLALNAALEGTRAGEAGRGFSLVASQMQKLAENITVSVSEIKELTKNISEATNTTQLSMEEATKLARATTAATEQINLVTQQQRTSVEQVSAAMDDIATITNQVAAGTNQTITSTEELMNLADQLKQVVEKHRQAA